MSYTPFPPRVSSIFQCRARFKTAGCFQPMNGSVAGTAAAACCCCCCRCLFGGVALEESLGQTFREECGGGGCCVFASQRNGPRCRRRGCQAGPGGAGRKRVAAAGQGGGRLCLLLLARPLHCTARSLRAFKSDVFYKPRNSWNIAGSHFKLIGDRPFFPRGSRGRALLEASQAGRR